MRSIAEAAGCTREEAIRAFALYKPEALDLLGRGVSAHYALGRAVTRNTSAGPAWVLSVKSLQRAPRQLANLRLVRAERRERAVNLKPVQTARDGRRH